METLVLQNKKKALRSGLKLRRTLAAMMIVLGIFLLAIHMDHRAEGSHLQTLKLTVVHGTAKDVQALIKKRTIAEAALHEAATVVLVNAALSVQAGNFSEVNRLKRNFKAIVSQMKARPHFLLNDPSGGFTSLMDQLGMEEFKAIFTGRNG